MAEAAPAGLALASLNCNGLRGSDLRAAVQGATTPKIAALLGQIRQTHITVLVDVAGIDDAAMQQLLAPTHTWVWRPPSAHGKGRGVGFAVATNIAQLCTLHLSSGHGGLAWLKCSGKLFGVNQPVFLAAIYLPVVGSMHTLSAYEDRAHELVAQTWDIMQHGLHIWAGDFNADIWAASELPEGGRLLHQILQVAPALSSPRAIRGAAPHRLKQPAHVVLDIAAACGTVFLTGRKGDDGGSTFYAAHDISCRSRIDHIGLHHALWPKVLNAAVIATAADLSDHRPVAAYFQPAADETIDMGDPAAMCDKPARGAFGYDYLAWQPQQAATYSHMLQHDPVLPQLDAAIAAGHVDLAAALLSSLIMNAAAASGMIRTSRGGRNRPRHAHPSWWDDEVQTAYDALRRSSLDAQPGPVRAAARRRFKSVARRTKRRYDRRIAAVVADRLRMKQSAVFREYINEQRQRCPITAISTTAWEQHLRQQFAAHNQPATDQPAGEPQPANTTPGFTADSLSIAFDKAFGRMRQHTAAGLDGIAAPFIKLAVAAEPSGQPVHVLQSRLREWFVAMAMCGIMPRAWQPVRIQPIFKKGDPLQPANYRHIAITSVLYRLHASMLTVALDDWARQHGLIPHEQFGFQRRRSTTQAAFVLRHLVHAQQAAASRGHLHCAFVDLKKAYDSVDHALLWQHLSDSLHLPSDMLRAVQALYKGATYLLQDGYKQTPQVPVARGIKQGCPLSPLLFSLFISDLPSYLQRCCPAEGVACGAAQVRCLLYADDLTLLTTSANGLQSLLDTLHSYTTNKRMKVNIAKTEVVVFGGRLSARRQPQQVVYGPNRQPLKLVSSFKFLGLLMHESLRMKHTMAARNQPFLAALQQVSATAIRLRLGKHIPTRLRLAAVYAWPAANYGDVVWATAFLKPADALDTPLQRQLGAHLTAVVGLPASTPRWPLLSELQLQPMQHSWWSHIISFYNAALSGEGQVCSPLMAAALAADVHLAQRERRKPRTWAGQLLASLAALAPPGSGVLPAAHSAVLQQRAIPYADTMQLVQAAFRRQWSADRLGDPRDPAVMHRHHASYNAWFRSTAGSVLKYAQRHISSARCRCVAACLRYRLGAVGLAVNVGRRVNVPFCDRVCAVCQERTGGRHVDDALHACFECEGRREQLQQSGVAAHLLDGATTFQALFATRESTGRAVKYLAALAQLVDG